MTKSQKISLALVGVLILGLAIAVGAGRYLQQEPSSQSGTSTAPTPEILVREDSRVLTTGSRATLVEFLDFECEGCGAFYPVAEDIIERYGQDVTFVLRYLPLHVSSVNAIKAAEAAGAQDAYKEMYDLLFQRQDQWGHQDQPEVQMFFDYAEELGLDMDQFATNFDDPATVELIEQSEADARALGVTGTPTLFLDGGRIELTTAEALESALTEAIND